MYFIELLAFSSRFLYGFSFFIAFPRRKKTFWGLHCEEKPGEKLRLVIRNNNVNYTELKYPMKEILHFVCVRVFLAGKYLFSSAMPCRKGE